MGEILDFEKMDLSAKIKRDYEQHKRFKAVIERYWRRLGHTVTVEIKYNPTHKVYQLVSSDMKNGLPIDKPITQLCYDRAVKLGRYE